MSDENEVSKGRVRRRTSPRRERVQGGRQHRHEVKVTPEEEAQLLQLALAQHVTIPRLLVEAALAGDRETSTQRRELLAEFASAHRLLAQVSNNVNQIAHTFNTVSMVMRKGEGPDDALLAQLERDLAATPAALDAVRRVAERLDDVAEQLAG